MLVSKEQVPEKQVEISTGDLFYVGDELVMVVRSDRSIPGIVNGVMLIKVSCGYVIDRCETIVEINQKYKATEVYDGSQCYVQLPLSARKK